MSTCKICNDELFISETISNNEIYVSCKRCGKYSLDTSIISDKNFDRTNLYKISSWIREQNDMYANKPKIDQTNLNKILEMKDKKIQEKFDLLIVNLDKFKNQHITSEIYAQCWIKSKNEFNKLFKRVIDKNLISGTNTNIGGEVSFSDYTFEGIQYIEMLDEPNKSYKNIFVAFNFENELKEVFNNYVRQAIEELGFNYIVVNQNTTEHNKAISDKIIGQLKSSCIVIADFTNHRNSVYFEAGFAMGMKIPIIWTCKEGDTDKLSFDTRQYPHLIWKDGEDLKNKIINRIKVII